MKENPALPPERERRGLIGLNDLALLLHEHGDLKKTQEATYLLQSAVENIYC